MKKLLLLLLAAATFVALHTSLSVKATASCSVAGGFTYNYQTMTKNGGVLCKVSP